MDDERWLEQLAEAADFEAEVPGARPGSAEGPDLFGTREPAVGDGAAPQPGCDTSRRQWTVRVRTRHFFAAARRTDRLDEPVSRLPRARAGGAGRPCADFLATLPLLGIPPLAGSSGCTRPAVCQKRRTNPNRF